MKMITAYRIFLCVLLHFLLGFAFVQWLTIQPVFYALLNHPDFLVVKGTVKGGGKCASTANAGNPPNPENVVPKTAGEFLLNLTNLVCHKINKDIEGDSPYTHSCKFVDGGGPT